MPDFDDQLRAALAAKAGAWTPGVPPLPEAAATHRSTGLIAVAATVGLVLVGGVTALATHGSSPGSSTIAAAPAVSAASRALPPVFSPPTSSASPLASPASPTTIAPALPSATANPFVTPGGPHGPVGPPSPSASASTATVTHTLGPPSRDYALHTDLQLSGGGIELVPSAQPPLATATQVMVAYRAMFTSQAAYLASKPTYKYGVLRRSSGATVLGPQVGRVIWIVGNDSVKVLGSGPASAPGGPRPRPVTSRGAYNIYDGVTGWPLIGFSG